MVPACLLTGLRCGRTWRRHVRSRLVGNAAASTPASIYSFFSESIRLRRFCTCIWKNPSSFSIWLALVARAGHAKSICRRRRPVRWAQYASPGNLDSLLLIPNATLSDLPLNSRVHCKGLRHSEKDVRPAWLPYRSRQGRISISTSICHPKCFGTLRSRLFHDHLVTKQVLDLLGQETHT